MMAGRLFLLALAVSAALTSPRVAEAARDRATRGTYTTRCYASDCYDRYHDRTGEPRYRGERSGRGYRSRY